MRLRLVLTLILSLLGLLLAACVGAPPAEDVSARLREAEEPAPMCDEPQIAPGAAGLLRGMDAYEARPSPKPAPAPAPKPEGKPAMAPRERLPNPATPAQVAPAIAQ